ncbi:MAG: 2-C-methyl-D-erythritol 4-phosphate cytidylyltransferase [bacterium]|nr:2-C-methyl-D-erythritol 4-phosphate cytidylyltransferase [Gemmatimonadota bacterium]HIL89071.1 2-C-methyl-D-erythritol 4-phosphate cytidylyltransferase [Gemmatimonadota bacterium]
MSAPQDSGKASPHVGVVVPAAGSGTRMGGTRKPFLELDGEPLLVHALRPFLRDDRVVSVVVSLAPQDVDEITDWIRRLDDRIKLVKGGVNRTESVRNAVSVLPTSLDVIAIHDAARPLVTSAIVGKCIDLANTGVCAVSGCPVIDTIKRVDEEFQVLETVDRSVFWHAHTPQVFPADLLRQAYESGEVGTDDAVLLESFGARLQMVDDGGTNIKVTRPTDLMIAQAILRLQCGDV